VVFYLFVVGHHERDDHRHGEIGTKDDDQRQDDAERDGPFGVFGLFACSVINVNIFCKIKFQTQTRPVAAMESNPTKAKKHLAAPAMIPANPKGTKPPVPQSWVPSVHGAYWVKFSVVSPQLSPVAATTNNKIN
jgi:hypothetical protein